jgi:TldD protein
VKLAVTSRIAICLCLLAIVPASFSAQEQGGAAPTDPVLRAMADELQRSVSELQLKDLDKPYFIQYVVLDQDEYRAEATFGAVTNSDRTKGRVLQAQVRVGDYEFDNSEFIPGGGFQGAPPSGVLVPAVIENDYNAIRHALWLATDGAYKQSIEQLARKRAFVQNKVREEQIPDFSKESAVTVIGASREMQVDSARWEKQLREWSAIFRDFPEIQRSAISVRALMTHKYLVNSEGTRTVQPSMLASLEIGASTEAADGMRLAHSIPFNARSFDELPSAAVITESIRRLATDLTSLRSAPVLDADYSGPVLFTGQASAEMFARVLGPNLSGQRLPLSERDQQSSSNRSELSDRMNRPVLPSTFSVYDDPKEQRVGDQVLIGHYEIDDQGVPAQRVSLIEDGILKTLLMSRRPGKDMKQSNGHGRSGLPGRESAQIGNLFIQVNDGKAYEDLKQQLIKMCRLEKLDYGIVIKALNPDGRSQIGKPVLTYKLYVEDGREELIRGASADSIAVRSLRQIEAVGNDSFVANRLTGGDLPTPMSVVAPSVLLEEVELKRPAGTQQKPSLLTHPYFTTN